MITYAGSVEQVWPEVSSRLTAYLTSRGTSSHDCEDLVQECAARLLHHQVAFTDASDLLRWCLTVARNAHVDLCRRQANLAPAVNEDVVAQTDVHREVTARLELRAVTAAWKRLSQSDQRVLAETVEQVPTPSRRGDAVRLHVQRNRARRRLESLLVALAGVLVWLVRATRRVVPPLGSVTAAAVVTGLALSPWSGPTTPERTVEAVLPDTARPAVQQPETPPRTRRTVPQAVTHTSGVSLASSPARRATSVQGPEGASVTVEGHDRPAGPPTILCAGDLGVVPDTCVPDPTEA